jgi:hypothetical protein
MLEKSAHGSRGKRRSQVVKTVDALLAAWNVTLARRRTEGAIFDTRRRILFRFGEIEELSGRYEEQSGCGLRGFERERSLPSRSGITLIGRRFSSPGCGARSWFCRSNKR